MKNLKLLILTLFGPILLNAQESTYSLTGKVPVFKVDEKVYLLKGSQVDSAAFGTGGEFVLEGTVEDPQKVVLMIAKDLKTYSRNQFSFYLEPGNLELSSPDSLKNAKVNGGIANQHNNLLNESKRKLIEDRNSLYKWYSELSEEDRKSEANKKKVESADNEIQSQIKNINKNFLTEHSDSPIALDVLKSIAGYSPDYEEVFPLFQALSSTVQSSTQGVQYLKDLKVYEALSIGKVAPGFSQLDTAGHVVNLSDFRGKYVLIDFWASWCGPCRAENPNVVKAFQSYKDKGFTVLGVSLDAEKSRDAWLKAIKDDNLQGWTQLSDLKGWKNEASTLYGVKAIPANFLLDPEGKIIAKDLRGAKLQEKLQEILIK